MKSRLYVQRFSSVDTKKTAKFSLTLQFVYMIGVFNLCSQAHATTVENYATSEYEISFATETGTSSITPQKKVQGPVSGPAIASYSSFTSHELQIETNSEARGSGGSLKTWTSISVQDDPVPNDLSWVDFNIRSFASSAFKDTISTSPHVHNARFYFVADGTLAVNADPDPAATLPPGSGLPPIDPNGPPPTLVESPFPGDLIANVSLSASLAGTVMSNNSSFETHELKWESDGDSSQYFNQVVSFDINIADLGLAPLLGGDLEVLLISEVSAISNGSSSGDFSGTAASIFDNTVTFSRLELFDEMGNMLSVDDHLVSQKGFDYSADAASVPLPFSGVLFTSGLAFLTWLGRRKRLIR